MNTIFKSILIGIVLGILTWIIKDWLKQSEVISSLESENALLKLFYDLKQMEQKEETKNAEPNE